MSAPEDAYTVAIEKPSGEVVERLSMDEFRTLHNGLAYKIDDLGLDDESQHAKLRDRLGRFV